MPLLQKFVWLFIFYFLRYGYFSSKEEIINPDCNIDFTKLQGKLHYYQTLKDMYDSGPKSAWLTPVEIFNVCPSFISFHSFLPSPFQLHLLVIAVVRACFGKLHSNNTLETSAWHSFEDIRNRCVTCPSCILFHSKHF